VSGGYYDGGRRVGGFTRPETAMGSAVTGERLPVQVNFEPFDPTTSLAFAPTEFSGGEFLSEESFACPECGKAFRTKTGLTHHMEVHKGLTDCPLCGKTQSRVSNLKRHLALVHQVDQDLQPI